MMRVEIGRQQIDGYHIANEWVMRCLSSFKFDRDQQNRWQAGCYIAIVLVIIIIIRVRNVDHPVFASSLWT